MVVAAIRVTEEEEEHTEHTETPKEHIPIVHSESFHGFDGSFKHRFESANGILVEEHGSVKDVGDSDHKANVVHGSYSYIDPKGIPVAVHYTADENGFHAHGSHIPTPKPVPEY